MSTIFGKSQRRVRVRQAPRLGPTASDQLCAMACVIRSGVAHDGAMLSLAAAERHDYPKISVVNTDFGRPKKMKIHPSDF